MQNDFYSCSSKKSMNINNTPILLEIALVNRYACQTIIQASKPFYLKVYGLDENCNGESYYNMLFEKHGRKCWCFQLHCGNLSAIKWLYTNNIQVCLTDPTNPTEECFRYVSIVRSMDLAARAGHLHVIKYLHDNGQVCSEAAMNMAAEFGHFDVVEWLHNNRSEGCTTKAMDWAASNGHLEIVKYLHNNRTEGCTETAMDWAASNGHLDVVEYLHNNRTEGCTAYAIDLAAEYGHLHVIKYLHAQGKYCTTRAMDYASMKGYLDIVIWLHENRAEDCTDFARHAAMHRAHTAIVDYLFAHNLDSNRDVKCDVIGCLGFGR